MKRKMLLPFPLVALGTLALLGMLVPQTKAAPPATRQAQVDELKKTYPLKTCSVSGDNLESNDMGESPLDYLYTQKNADGTETVRLIRFCCKGCVTKFKKDPEKYLKMLDDAQAKPSTPSATSSR